jgi:hypothetical protein
MQLLNLVEVGWDSSALPLITLIVNLAVLSVTG